VVTVTLADVRLTTFRFDIAYYGLFKCNRRRIQDYQNLGSYLRDLYQLPARRWHPTWECETGLPWQPVPANPGGIIPSGPDVTNLLEPHGRDSVGKGAVLKD